MEIVTKTLINATPPKVWQILMNFEDYPNWNPFIKLITGVVKVGNTITVKIQPPGSKAMTFTPQILALESNKLLLWRGKLLFSGIFDGEHRFELVNSNDGSTTFLHSENFKGLLVPLFRKQLDTNTKRGFEAMNIKLKELAES